MKPNKKKRGRPLGSCKTKGTQKVAVCFRLAPDLVQWLRCQHNQARAIDVALRFYIKGVVHNV